MVCHNIFIMIHKFVRKYLRTNFILQIQYASNLGDVATRMHSSTIFPTCYLHLQINLISEVRRFILLFGLYYGNTGCGVFYRGVQN